LTWKNVATITVTRSGTVDDGFFYSTSAEEADDANFLTVGSVNLVSGVTTFKVDGWDAYLDGTTNYLQFSRANSVDPFMGSFSVGGQSQVWNPISSANPSFLTVTGDSISDLQLAVNYTNTPNFSFDVAIFSTGGAGGEGGGGTTPEPATMLIFGCGIVGAGLAARRRMKK
jgi:hypothetical protein